MLEGPLVQTTINFETIYVLENGDRLCEDGKWDYDRAHPLDDGSPLHHTETVPVMDKPTCDCHGE